MAEEKTIFEKFATGEIKCNAIYEDDKCLAFRDINPAAPVHILLIPKKKITQLSLAEESDAEILGHLMVTVGKIAKQEKLDEGFRIVVNDGKQGGQTVYYLHIHILGGGQCTWPPGTPLKGADKSNL
eukprot:CAMPEP_0176437606 /NCGR_PEP_ID=MMETSP0127-20121128/18735_1 /TAXON_ID=938130 /ORGANISM="Platyophrya macrostoma, Strain WH" /LENGTH=126 /DNA_ID=CAMNT_0017821291 /DNA_START=88 /DNA_END=468 /DNA_ORIENTATION=+